MAGISITVQGLEAAKKLADERGQRARNLTPAMKFIARDVEKRTDDAFRRSTSPKGERWAPLKESTKRQRAGRLKGARGNTKLRRAILAPGGTKPLVDTGRLRNSQHAVATGSRVRWSAVGYGGPHITGSAKGNPPKRNFTVFEFSGRWRLIPVLRGRYAKTILRYIETGRPV